MAAAAGAFLAAKIAAASGAEAETWQQLETLYNRKLWHQLTLALEAFVTSPAFAAGGLMELYTSFIKDFEDKINGLSLINLALVIVSQLPDIPSRSSFLEAFRTKVANNPLAKVCLITSLADHQLKLSDLEKAKALLDECSQILDTMDSVSEMHANFYRVSADYFKIKADFQQFYTDALRYLGCIPLERISVEEQVQRAFDLCLAGLLGQGIYNFGELLAHPILDSLKGTEKQWLVDLIFAFNSGDIPKFEALKPQWSQQQDLASSETSLRQKISLLALMELVFSAPAHQRGLSFAAIAQVAYVPQGDVEWLVMKALSLKLVKGSIDEVEKKANLHWVQPRVLDLQQVGKMKERLEIWCATVDNTAKMVSNQTPELFVE